MERPQSQTFAAALTFAFGSYNDPRSLPGAAHFSEHLAFRGANREVVARLTEGGGSANANTGGEHTQFFASGPANKLSLALDFFGNILANQPLTDVDVARERNVFRHELATSRSNARQSHLDQHWRITLGDPNWRMGRRYQLARIPRLTSERVNSWRLAHYRISAARLAIVSPLACDDLRTMLETQLGEMSPPDTTQPEPLPERPADCPRIMFSVDRDQYAWVYVTHIVRSTSPIVRLTAELLSRRLHSTLFRRLREERALAYGVFADDWEMLSLTAINCHCTVSRHSVSEALDVILQSQHELLTQRIDETQFESEKDVLRQRLESWCDHPARVAAYVAHESHRLPADDLSDPSRRCEALSLLTIGEFYDAASTLMASDNRQVFLGGRFGPIARYRLKRQLRRASVPIPPASVL